MDMMSVIIKNAHIAFAQMALALFLVGSTYGQHTNGWELFENVQMEPEIFSEFELTLNKPQFDKNIRDWEGKEITLRGYIIPTDYSGSESLILSKYPLAVCYFCGGAGIDSVAEIWTNENPRKFGLHKQYIFKGKLKLNESDMDHLNFILTDAYSVSN